MTASAAERAFLLQEREICQECWLRDMRDPELIQSGDPRDAPPRGLSLKRQASEQARGRAKVALRCESWAALFDARWWDAAICDKSDVAMLERDGDAHPPFTYYFTTAHHIIVVYAIVCRCLRGAASERDERSTMVLARLLFIGSYVVSRPALFYATFITPLRLAKASVSVYVWLFVAVRRSVAARPTTRSWTICCLMVALEGDIQRSMLLYGEVTGDEFRGVVIGEHGVSNGGGAAKNYDSCWRAMRWRELLYE